MIVACRRQYQCVYRAQSEADSHMEGSVTIANQILWLCIVRQFVGTVFLQLCEWVATDAAANANRLPENIGQRLQVWGVCANHQSNRWLLCGYGSVCACRTWCTFSIGHRAQGQCGRIRNLWVNSWINVGTPWMMIIKCFGFWMLQWLADGAINGCLFDDVRLDQHWRRLISSLCSRRIILWTFGYGWPQVRYDRFKGATGDFA